MSEAKSVKWFAAHVTNFIVTPASNDPKVMAACPCAIDSVIVLFDIVDEDYVMNSLPIVLPSREYIIKCGDIGANIATAYGCFDK